MESKRRVYNRKKGGRDLLGRPGKSRIHLKRPTNRYCMEKETASVSTSAKKLKMSDNQYEIHTHPTFGYRFIDFVTVFSALSQLLVCKTCGTTISFNETQMRGLGYKIVVKCDKCEPRVITAIPVINKYAYEINRRIVFAMRLIGVGFNGILKFCALMDLPRPIFHSFYDTIVRNISIATAVVREKSMKQAVAQEKVMCEEKGQTDGVTVSGDGSWRKRGFSSLYGITSLIGWHTGKIVDVLVKSKFCKSCDFWKNKKGTAEYEEWAESHNDNCQMNHAGSSGKMEVDSIVEMFSRSEQLHGIKYSNYIGDGDCKTFKGITDAQPYDDIIVRKKECIDHVQKRMGTRLRNLKKKN